MGKFWAIFFVASAILAVAVCAVAPDYQWWFPGDGRAHSTLGQKIDDLFYLILVIVAVTFIGTQAALGYVLWKGATPAPEQKALFTHGSHTLEVIWTIVPSGILLFIALYQMDVWAQYRIRSYYPKAMEPVAEVTARQFEWRIRYPALGKRLMPTPQPDDIYTVNDLRVPTGHPVAISLRSDDVQHSFFVPELRVKQDAVPGLVIPVWWEMTDTGTFDLTCAELCGWGHYKMRGRVMAMSEAEFLTWKNQAAQAQFFDGTTTNATASEADSNN